VDPSAILALLGNLKLLQSTRCPGMGLFFGHHSWLLEGLMPLPLPAIATWNERCYSLFTGLSDWHQGQGCCEIHAVIEHPLPRQTHAATVPLPQAAMRPYKIASNHASAYKKLYTGALRGEGWPRMYVGRLRPFGPNGQSQTPSEYPMLESMGPFFDHHSRPLEGLMPQPLSGHHRGE